MGHDLSNADILTEVFLYCVSAVVSYQWNYYATLLCALSFCYPISHYRCLAPGVFFPERVRVWGTYVQGQVCVCCAYKRRISESNEDSGTESQLKHSDVLACQLFCSCGLCAR